MWNGGRSSQEEDAEDDPDSRTRLAASALAAYANADPNYRYDPAQYASSNPLLSQYGSQQYQAVEALRRQEEIRQQALLQALQTRQELHELEYARRLQQQAAANLAQRQDAFASRQQEGTMYEANADKEPYRSNLKTGEGKEGQESRPPEPMEVDNERGLKPALHVSRGKPEAVATALAAARIRKENEEEVATAVAVADDSVEAQAQAEVAVAAPLETPKKKKAKRKAAATTPRSRKKSPAPSSGPTLDDPVPPITSVEYENVEALMEQFCRVPLLAEFSRPVSLLHPELVPVYSKIVSHPIDLGRVCRNIRRRQYRDTRAIRLDMWRIFTNCIKYHTHPHNKDNAVPSFVSIALHLRDYFNALWEEYMLPSDPPAVPIAKSPRVHSSDTTAAFAKRENHRKKRMATTGATMLSERCMEKTANAIRKFIEMEGRVDKLDADGIFGDEDMDDEGDMDEVVENLQTLQRRIADMARDEEDYSVEELDKDMRKCYMGDLFESKPSLRIKVAHRIDRLLGKIIVNIYEANSRGVNQSSIWGCMAAAIWARESSKKPYWPALVLGIMAPDDQKEDWHTALTERNEKRFPEKLRTDLQAAKRRAELAIRRQNAGTSEQMSYFLVEFMGTHEFIWVKESDMIESFDPDVDPNQSVAAGNVTKKKRSSRSNDVFGSQTFTDALEEGRWALEEFELQLSDTCGDLLEEDEDDEQETNYSYAVLCQSDDEADGEDSDRDTGAESRKNDMTVSETEETNELLATEGLLDFSAAGRKNAKKRTAERKKRKADAEKAAQKKEKSARKTKQTKIPKRSQKSKTVSGREKEKEEKREQRELERRRKKRARERDRVLKEESRKKKRRLSGEPSGKNRSKSGIFDKGGRASAIVKAYLMRIAKKEDMKSLGMAGVMTVPAAQVDSTGLLGMALAFRAAAGELAMPESGEPVSKMKPWEDVDVASQIKAEDRVQNLTKKKLLLEEEIKRIKAATQRRKDLTDAATKERQQMEAQVAANDKEARKTSLKKRKKAAKAEPKGDGATSNGKKEIPATENEEEKQEPVVVLSKDIESVEPGVSSKENGASDGVVSLKENGTEKALVSSKENETVEPVDSSKENGVQHKGENLSTRSPDGKQSCSNYDKQDVDSKGRVDVVVACASEENTAVTGDLEDTDTSKVAAK